jgi:hypothetical protein
VRGDIGLGRRWLGVAILAALACGDPEPVVVQDGEQAEAFCNASCTRSSECGAGGSAELCQSYCEPNVTFLEGMRPEAMQVIARCIVEIPCTSFFDEGAFDPCWERAREELGPTQSVRDFCQEWSRRWYECGYSYPVEMCEFDWGINKADRLERVLLCTDLPCEELDACTDAAVVAS